MESRENWLCATHTSCALGPLSKIAFSHNSQQLLHQSPRVDSFVDTHTHRRSTAHTHIRAIVQSNFPKPNDLHRAFRAIYTIINTHQTTTGGIWLYSSFIRGAKVFFFFFFRKINWFLYIVYYPLPPPPFFSTRVLHVSTPPPCARALILMPIRDDNLVSAYTYSPRPNHHHINHVQREGNIYRRLTSPLILPWICL